MVSLPSSFSVKKAAVGSARLEGYKGSLKLAHEKGKEVGRPESKMMNTAKL